MTETEPCQFCGSRGGFHVAANRYRAMEAEFHLKIATEALNEIVRLGGIAAELIARKAMLIIGGESDVEAEGKAVSETLVNQAKNARDDD
jgi:hypothetical protein